MVAQKTWDGSNSNFGNARHWNPAGVPQGGDTAIVRAGTMHAKSMDLSSVTFDVGSDQPVNDPELVLRNAVLDNVTVHAPSGPPSGSHPTRYADIAASGLVVETGTLGVGTTDPTGTGVPGDLEINLSRNATFDLTGQALEQGSSSLKVSGGPHSAFSNDGRFTDIGGTADFAVPVTGSGTFDVSRGKFVAGTPTFEDGVSAGEHVNLNTNSTLNLDRPLQFLGSITETPASDVVLKNTASTSASYANGVLTVLDNSKVVASLHINSINDMGFTVSQSGQDTLITTPGAIGASAMQLVQSSMNIPVLTQGS
jgi:hypothetical protein